MNQNEHLKYWIDTSEQDFNTMLHLYGTKDYHWSLFIGHLVIEKLLKAVYVKKQDSNVPRLHDLLRIADLAGLNTNDEQKDMLDLITTFNISARYPDYKQSFYKKCTEEFTTQSIAKIKELRSWLLLILAQK